MSAAILSMEAVGLSFGDKRVLDNLTFSVRRGEVFGFLGPSGVGKTSTIKLLTRQLARDGGRISLLGRPLERATEADYERVGILSDTSALYDRMSIADNVELYARLRGVGRRRVPMLLQRLGLAEDAKTLVKHCSKGMRQRAALAAALVHEPELLFLDEPTSGLDPAARAEVHKLLADLRARGATVFLTTHDMAEAETVCDRVAILADGAIAACDDPDELKLAMLATASRCAPARAARWSSPKTPPMSQSCPSWPVPASCSRCIPTSRTWRKCFWS